MVYNFFFHTRTFYFFFYRNSVVFSLSLSELIRFVLFVYGITPRHSVQIFHRAVLKSFEFFSKLGAARWHKIN